MDIRLLIVEHQAQERQRLRDSLKQIQTSNYLIAEVASGEAALDYCRQHPVDCVLLNSRLPGYHGAGLVKVLRPLLPQAPILMLTEMGDEVAAAEAIEQGAQYYLLKESLTPSKLHLAISRALELSQTALALDESRILYETLAEAIPHLVWMVDVEAKVSYTNQRFREYTGLRQEDIQRLDWKTIVHQEDADPAAWREAIQQEQPFQIERRLHNQEGHYRWFLIRFVPLAPPYSPRWIATATDIQDQKLAEQSARENERFIQRIANTVPGLLYIYDLEDHHNLYANDQIKDILGYTQAQIQEMGHRFLEQVVHPDDHPILLDARNQLYAADDEDAVEIEYRVKTARGEWRWLLSREMVFIRQPDGVPLQILGIGQDITRRKAIELAEREQRQLAEALSKTALVLNSSLDFSAVLDHILNQIGEVIPHHTANIMLVEDSIARIVRARGFRQLGLGAILEDLLQKTWNIQEEAHMRQMMETQQPYFIPNILLALDGADRERMSPLRAYLGIPILVQGEILGFINLNSTIIGFFTEQHAQRLASFAAQAAVAINNARLYAQGEELAVVKERERLARDLHDAVSQTLFTSNLIAQSLPRLAQKNEQKAWEQLDKLTRLNRGALAEMRTLLLELRWNDYMTIELDQLLQQLLQAAMGHAEFEAVLEAEDGQQLPQEVKIAFYRVAQECLNNIMKHAHASQVSLRLYSDADEVVWLEVRDNGVGFDPRKISWTSMGLNIIRERAESIGAQFTLESREGEGTVIRLAWREGGFAQKAPPIPGSASG